MKLLVTIIHEADMDRVSHALTSENLRVTQIASTSGFWRRGMTTLLIGLEDDQVEKAIEIIRNNCTAPNEPDGKKATIFVIKVDQFVQF